MTTAAKRSEDSARVLVNLCLVPFNELCDKLGVESTERAVFKRRVMRLALKMARVAVGIVHVGEFKITGRTDKRAVWYMNMLGWKLVRRIIDGMQQKQQQLGGGFLSTPAIGTMIVLAALATPVGLTGILAKKQGSRLYNTLQLLASTDPAASKEIAQMYHEIMANRGEEVTPERLERIQRQAVKREAQAKEALVERMRAFEQEQQEQEQELTGDIDIQAAAAEYIGFLKGLEPGASLVIKFANGATLTVTLMEDGITKYQLDPDNKNQLVNKNDEFSLAELFGKEVPRAVSLEVKGCNNAKNCPPHEKLDELLKDWELESSTGNGTFTYGPRKVPPKQSGKNKQKRKGVPLASGSKKPPVCLNKDFIKYTLVYNLPVKFIVDNFDNMAKLGELVAKRMNDGDEETVNNARALADRLRGVVELLRGMGVGMISPEIFGEQVVALFGGSADVLLNNMVEFFSRGRSNSFDRVLDEFQITDKCMEPSDVAALVANAKVDLDRANNDESKTLVLALDPGVGKRSTEEKNLIKTLLGKFNEAGGLGTQYKELIGLLQQNINLLRAMPLLCNTLNHYFGGLMKLIFDGQDGRTLPAYNNFGKKLAEMVAEMNTYNQQLIEKNKATNKEIDDARANNSNSRAMVPVTKPVVPKAAKGIQGGKAKDPDYAALAKYIEGFEGQIRPYVTISYKNGAFLTISKNLSSVYFDSDYYDMSFSSSSVRDKTNDDIIDSIKFFAGSPELKKDQYGNDPTLPKATAITISNCGNKKLCPPNPTLLKGWKLASSAGLEYVYVPN